MSGLAEVQIAKKTTWAPGLISLALDAPPVDFTPGQFFNLGFKSEGAVVRRSYSAASAPGAPLEFFLSEVPGGTLTPHLFTLKEGDTLYLDTKPLGFFTLNEVPATKALWLAATGTGLGPYLSMLRSGALLERFERIILVHGVRDPSRLAYRSELAQYAQVNPRVSYVPTLSAGQLTEPDVLSGRITSNFESGALETHVGCNFGHDSHMLLCGNPQMIEEMSHLLKARGFEKHRRKKAGHFNFEKYW